MEMFEIFVEDTVRDSFGKTLCELGKQDDRVVLVSADSMGASKTTLFNRIYPERSYNVGIAEQSMVSFAAGLANEGFLPYVSTRAPFLSMRAAEQVRTAVCYDNLPVKFIGTGSGYCSGTAGATHWALEDVAIMSSFGNMTVFETGDRILLRKILLQSIDWSQPMYIRLGKDTEEILYKENDEIELDKANILKDGTQGYFIVSGTVVNFAMQAADMLEKERGLNVGVIDMFCLKPIDKAAIRKAAETKSIVVAQDHNKIGGLGSLVERVILEEYLSCKVSVLGCPDHFLSPATSDYLYHKFGYDTEGLVNSMWRLCNERK